MVCIGRSFNASEDPLAGNGPDKSKRYKSSKKQQGLNMSTIEAMVAKAFKTFLEGGKFEKMLSKTLGGDDASESEEQEEKEEAKPTRRCMCCGKPKPRPKRQGTSQLVCQGAQESCTRA